MKDYTNTYYLQASPDNVYEAITDASILEKWTKSKATMSLEEGSEFSMWDGQIKGRNVSFEKGKKVVQQWFFDEGKAQSIVTITIEKEDNNSCVSLSHTNIPNELYESFRRGWQESYFGPLAEFFNEN